MFHCRILNIFFKLADVLLCSVHFIWNCSFTAKSTFICWYVFLSFFDILAPLWCWEVKIPNKSNFCYYVSKMGMFWAYIVLLLSLWDAWKKNASYEALLMYKLLICIKHKQDWSLHFPKLLQLLVIRCTSCCCTIMILFLNIS